ncbi:MULTISPECIES: type II toxin-antitoxin system VapC family toxin [unclassified Oleiphilus]|jgi:predicted nucleic acid-binding protein|uniref:type II toxin-antitoxin system VapC family toxin n=1 Tax=unclassified Oleiphilus TaxID=2631174 RepID=UPI0007C378B4|nr:MULTISPECIES: type II toxin-antitoxin system VapC family toxin [unclassified Oleiphilus]KZY41057.1 DNA-binding protein [Oleiphilus sp. HI0050]KZY73500.1 DNA-binding protein [Oleiphilus sp. HI0068]KZY80790.1 DNA-binding protein [Oleiphilus sp. HI0069]KZY85803.1 DNA-binding protein [Oleiphilus sp. HI0072]KZZ10072.1 DNA-binding protein [Oleiphilus sp. HI0078]KZZ29922.1 DNA-binding protein [Oleiphilus sp. HI0081]KZZ46537.1 DNA-binding protein [Oleiphilus sp. HI0085]
MIVADTNTIAYLYLPSDYSEYVEALLLKDPDWIAPILWRSELRNILALYLRKELISMEDALEIQQQAENLLKDNEYTVNSFEVLNTANESGCSAYDSEFICLAKSQNCKLVTADKKILKQFPDIAISAREYVA